MQQEQSNLRRSTMTFLVAVLIAWPAMIGSADMAVAQASTSPFGPLETAVQMIVDFVNGPFGRLIAIIAVMGLGFMAFAGRLSWFTAGAVIIGIGLVFGSTAIVDNLKDAVES